MDILESLKKILPSKEKVDDDDMTVTSTDFKPAPPRVDLLPQWVRDATKAQRARKGTYIASGAVVAATIAVWGLGFVESKDAEEYLATAEASQEQASIEIGKYAAVTNLAVQTNALLDTVKTQANGVNHQEVLNRFLAASDGILDKPSIAIATDGAGSCVSTDPFNQVPLAGCITFGGEGDATTLLRSLAEEPWFSDAFIPSIGQGEGGVSTVSGSVGITMSALPVVETDEVPAPATTPEEGQ